MPLTPLADNTVDDGHTYDDDGHYDGDDDDDDASDDDDDDDDDDAVVACIWTFSHNQYEFLAVNIYIWVSGCEHLICV